VGTAGVGVDAAMHGRCGFVYCGEPILSSPDGRETFIETGADTVRLSGAGCGGVSGCGPKAGDTDDWFFGADVQRGWAAILAKDAKFNAVRLKICGGQTAADERYVQTIREKLQRCGLAGQVEWIEDFGIESRKTFLQRISLMCVPVRKAAAYGLCVLEAMACGVGFIEPRSGVFEELAQLSRAGVLYEPNEPAALAEAIRPLLSDRGAVMQMGQKARQAIESHFDIRKTSQSLIKLLEGVRR
jgi:glycosyltransferase involved in cell wall biosynthesis